MHILALDLAGRVGWARWRQGIEPVFGTMKLPTATEGLTYAAFRDFLVGKVVAEGIDHIVVEDPFVSPDRISAVARIYALQGIAKEVAHRRNITIDGLAIGTWRKNFLGNASAPKSVPKNKRTDWLKEECIKECARRGWVVKYHDEADALGILVYERARLVPNWASEGGLFGFGAPAEPHPDSVRA